MALGKFETVSTLPKPLAGTAINDGGDVYGFGFGFDLTSSMSRRQRSRTSGSRNGCGTAAELKLVTAS